MKDRDIIALYESRSESAIEHTQRKYDKYCHAVAMHILQNAEDAKECVNDAYHRLWNAIPPNRPRDLKAYLACVVRRLALDRCNRQRAAKRGNGDIQVVLSELEECLPSATATEDTVLTHELTARINALLAQMPPLEKWVFMRRYWNMDSVKDIASAAHMTESHVKVMLHRTRKKLKTQLEKEALL